MCELLEKYYKKVFTLEDLLLQLKIDLPSRNDILKQLSTILVTFDFNISGCVKQPGITNLKFEQMLYLVYCKINFKETEHFKFHFFKAKELVKFYNSVLSKDEPILRHHLMALENPSICYFLSEFPNDGYWWSQFYNYSCGAAAMVKHIVMYGNIFRRLKNTDEIYVQVCGFKFNQTYPYLVGRELDIANTRREETRKMRKKVFCNSEVKTEKCNDTMMNEENKSIKSFQEIFEIEFHKNIENNIENQPDDAKFQIKKLGNTKIALYRMMYSRNFRHGIPKRYIYSTKSVETDELAKVLLHTKILDRIKLVKYENINELNAMQDGLIVLLRNFISNYRTCPTHVFLNYYCEKPMKELKMKEANKTKSERSRNSKRKRNLEKKTEKTQPTFNDFVHTKYVNAFIRRCLTHILEKSDQDEESFLLIGGIHNFKILCGFIKCILNSLLHDTLSINNCIDGIRTSTIKYLWPIKCHRYKRIVLMSLLLWLIEDYVLAIIHSCFYVTETCSTNTKVFFYLKETWKAIIDQKFDNPKKDYNGKYNLEKITDATAKMYTDTRQTAGIYMGRLLPKTIDKDQSEFRIISGSKAMNFNSKKQFKVNYQFISLFQCLKYLIKNDRSLIGFATPTHRDIERRYVKFLESTTYNRPANIYDPIKKWNFYKIDIKNCFDNIDTDEILYFIKDKFNQLLDNDQKLFTLFSFWSLGFDLDKKHIKKKFNYLTQLHLIEQKGFYNGIQDFINMIEENNKSYKSLRKCILIPTAISERNINSTKLVNSLSLCFNNVLIKIHDQLFIRVNGILHGSICSRIICDLYFGKIETSLFNTPSFGIARLNSKETLDEEENNRSQMTLNVANELILRIVDDYLVISDSVERFNRIKTLLSNNLKLNHTKTVEILWSKPSLIKVENEYKCYNQIEKGKNSSNQIEIIVISDSDPDDDDDDVEILNDNFGPNINFLSNNSEQYITWNGFNIDIHTLDFYYNFDKYFNTDLTDRISRNWIKKNGFYEFNLKFLRLFDNIFNTELLINFRINRIQAVIRNLIDMFALSSIRFQVLLQIKAIPDEIINDISLQIKLIFNLCYLGNNKVKKQLRDFIYESFSSLYLLLKFLCLNVFINTLKFNNKNNCKKLCRVLQKLLNKLDFIKSIRLYNANDVILQLNFLIDQQLEKFKNCQFFV